MPSDILKVFCSLCFFFFPLFFNRFPFSLFLLITFFKKKKIGNEFVCVCYDHKCPTLVKYNFNYLYINSRVPPPCKPIFKARFT